MGGAGGFSTNHQNEYDPFVLNGVALPLYRVNDYVGDDNAMDAFHDGRTKTRTGTGGSWLALNFVNNKFEGAFAVDEMTVDANDHWFTALPYWHKPTAKDILSNMAAQTHQQWVRLWPLPQEPDPNPNTVGVPTVHLGDLPKLLGGPDDAQP